MRTLSVIGFFIIRFILTENCASQTFPYVSESQANDSTENCANPHFRKAQGQNVRVVFYNTENLFDPFEDSLSQNQDFTMNGTKKWSYGKFSQKINHLAKTLCAIGGFEPCTLIGFCEVENRFVLRRLITHPLMKKYQYGIIHFESPDSRGIDVALLYRKEKFRPIYSRPVRISLPGDSSFRTRDILYVSGILLESDTLHLFVNHWPSKRGGSVQSEYKRKYVASVLRNCVDTLLIMNRYANILIMGDFNDEPDQASLTEVLRARPRGAANDSRDLINLMYGKHENWRIGTHKFQGKWSVIDQIIVSSSIQSGSNGLQVSPDGAEIFGADFLLEQETTFLGSRPYRTYAGPRYTGGFSDHLPIYVDIRKK